MAKKTAHKKKMRFIFPALYAAEFLALTVISILGISVYTYKKYSGSWTFAAVMILFSSLYLTAFCHSVYGSRQKYNVIMSSIVFFGGLLCFLLTVFLDGVFDVLPLVFAIVMASVIGVRYMLQYRADHKKSAKVDFKQVMCILLSLLFSLMRQMNVEYVNDMIFAWALVPATVIAAFAGAVTIYLLHDTWGEIYPTKGKSVGNGIIIGISLFFAAYMFSVTAIGTVNVALDSDPVQAQYTVVDKHINSGRYTADYEVEVTIDGESEWIPVPATEYHEIKKGDTVVIDYYGGALGFAYYSYRSQA